MVNILNAPVKEVILFEDRAQVVRRGRTELRAGQIKLQVEDVAPVVADRTLQAALRLAPEGSQVSDIHVLREYRPIDDREETETGDLERLLREVTAERESLAYSMSLTRKQQELVEQMIDRTLEDVATDVAWGQSKPDEWRQGLNDLADREAALRKEILDLETRQRDIEEKLTDLRRLSETTDRPDRHLTTSIVIELVCPTPGDVEIEITYIVPAACWRPLHTARLTEDDTGQQSVAFITEACVWQCCGEDWPDVDLLFSTQRPSLGFEPPLLGEDVLTTRAKPEAVVVEARDQVIYTTGLGSTTQSSEALPGIDDGGVPLTMKAEHNTTIPSDGRPYRVKTAEFTCAATTELVSMPELDPCVHRKVTLVNEGSSPILAGPVELIRDNGLVGRSPVLFVAPGERFAIGFGPDPAIRVRRKVAEVEPKQAALSRFVATEHNMTIQISNIGIETKQLNLTERVPVSEVEQVVVEFDSKASTGDAKPDENGIIFWNLELPPGGRETRHFRYTVKKRKGVIG